MTQAFGVTEEQMQKATEILGKNERAEKSVKFVGLTTKRVWTRKLQQQCRRKRERKYISYKQGIRIGTTFKIKVDDCVFSSLFNTGAQVSCIKHDTVAVLGLLHQISESSTCIRTANGQDVGVEGINHDKF